MNSNNLDRLLQDVRDACVLSGEGVPADEAVSDTAETAAAADACECICAADGAETAAAESCTPPSAEEPAEASAGCLPADDGGEEPPEESLPGEETSLCAGDPSEDPSEDAAEDPSEDAADDADFPEDSYHAEGETICVDTQSFLERLKHFIALSREEREEAEGAEAFSDEEGEEPAPRIIPGANGEYCECREFIQGEDGNYYIPMNSLFEDRDGYIRISRRTVRATCGSDARSSTPVDDDIILEDDLPEENESLLGCLFGWICEGLLELGGAVADALRVEPAEDDHKTIPDRIGYTLRQAVACLLVLLLLGSCVLNAHSLKAMVSMSQLDVGPNVYSVTYDGNYGFNRFLAQGGASSDEELMKYISKRFSAGLIPMPEPEKAGTGSESVLAVRNSQRREGALVGHSHCGSSETVSMIAVTRGRYCRTVSVVDLGCLGYSSSNRPEGLNKYAALAAVYLPLSGMNESGLVVTAMETERTEETPDTDRPDLTATTAVRLLLNSAGDTDRAAELLQRYDIFPSFGRHYDFAVSDHTGRCVIFSTAGGTITCMESPYAVNNCMSSPAGGPEEAADGEKLGQLEATYHRYDGHMNSGQVRTVMRRASSALGWSVVYDTARKTASYRFGTDREREFVVSIRY